MSSVTYQHQSVLCQSVDQLCRPTWQWNHPAPESPPLWHAVKQKPLWLHVRTTYHNSGLHAAKRSCLPTLPTSSTHPARTHQSSIQNVFCTFYTNKPTCTKPLKTCPLRMNTASQASHRRCFASSSEGSSSQRVRMRLTVWTSNESRRHIADCRPKYRSGDGIVCCTLELLPRCASRVATRQAWPWGYKQADVIRGTVRTCSVAALIETDDPGVCSWSVELYSRNWLSSIN